MLAYHNKTTIKNKYLKRVLAHQKADEIIKGKYWSGGKGCAVGCTIEGSDHSKYETELGIPKELAYIEDVLFEDMPNEDAMKWPARFLEAIQVGADLSKVTAQFVVWQFEDKEYGLASIQEIKDDKEAFGICEEVTNAYKKVILWEEVTNKEWIELYEKADKIYWARARAGSRARAWARAGAEYDKRTLIAADKLIDLIKNAPIKK